MQPYATVNYIIALQGTYPSRSRRLEDASSEAKVEDLNDEKYQRKLGGLDPFIGEIIMFAGNFAPRGWAFCDGQLLPISQNSALFSILGTTYGGDGRTTFALPDLRGRVPIHAGTSGPGLSYRNLGAKEGQEEMSLTVSQIPSHTHSNSIPVNTQLHLEVVSSVGPNP
jgi:microcystin-dependent protein